MKFLVIGLGSMGKRRIRNLKYLGQTDIIGYDISEERRVEAQSKYQITTFGVLGDALQEKPGAAIISTSPTNHYELAIKMAEQRIPFFMEANVIPDGFEKVIEECKKNGVFYAPSCTLRFNPSIRKIHELIKNNDIGKILEFIYHVGQYLPDWHPYEDYRKFYVSKKESGACREIVPFELNWITWTFGNVSGLTAIKRKISKLESDIDDIYSTILEFSDGKIGNLVVDVLSRVAYRSLKIVGEEGVILWEWTEKKVRVFHSHNKMWEEFNEPEGIKMEGYIAEEDQYIDEIRSFLEGIKNPSHYSHTPNDEMKVLTLLSKIEQSSDEGTYMKVC